MTTTETPAIDTPAITPQEFDVAVIFTGEDFTLSIRLTTDAGVPDEVRATAAAEGFADTYGFDPYDYDVEVAIEDLDETGRVQRALSVVRCNDCDALLLEDLALYVWGGLYHVCQECGERDYHDCDTCGTVPDEGGCDCDRK